jgi:hypothetical protein
MGVDISLPSIMDLYWKQNPKGPSWVFQKIPTTVAEHSQQTQDWYNALAATGGCFRNGYNAGDLMFALGRSWDEVYQMLDTERRLPIEKARELLAILEATPLSVQFVANYIAKHWSSGKNTHPVTGGLSALMEEVEGEAGDQSYPQYTEPPDLEDLHAFLNRKRDQLMALLRKSIQLNEPVEVS